MRIICGGENPISDLFFLVRQSLVRHFLSFLLSVLYDVWILGNFLWSHLMKEPAQNYRFILKDGI